MRYAYIQAYFAPGDSEALAFRHVIVEAQDVDQAYDVGFRRLGQAPGGMVNDYAFAIDDVADAVWSGQEAGVTITEVPRDSVPAGALQKMVTMMVTINKDAIVMSAAKTQEGKTTVLHLTSLPMQAPNTHEYLRHEKELKRVAWGEAHE